MKKKAFKASLVLIWAFASVFFASSALATPELDRRYALETVGLIRAWDNVDGLFADYVAAAYKDYFARQGRFVLQDLTKSDAVLAQSKVPYKKLIDDNDVLAQIAKAGKTSSLLRTKIQKEGMRYRFSIEWLHAPHMDVLASETFTLAQGEDPGAGGLGIADLTTALQAGLDRLVRKLPFLGHVTGRDSESVTVNLGAHAGIQPGDELLIGTLDDVKKHPIYKTIVDWRITRVGRVTIDQVDDDIAFGKVTEEDPRYPIASLQKVMRILPPAAKPKSRDRARGYGAGGAPVADGDGEEGIEGSEEDLESGPNAIPRLGWVAGGIGLGGLSRQSSMPVAGPSSITDSTKEGGGILIGAAVDGQLWFNSNLFADLGLSHGFWSDSQKDPSAAEGTPSVAVGSGTTTHFRLGVGYSYLMTGQFFGPKGWARLGYASTSYSLPINFTNQTGGASFKGLTIGVGGDIPLRGDFGALLSLDFGVFTSASRDYNISTTAAATSDATGASAVSFFLGGYCRFTTKLSVRGGVHVTSQSADFTDQVTTTNGTSARSSSLSFRAITLAPAVVYAF